MLQYLNYIKSELTKMDPNNQIGLLSELELYQKAYRKYEKITKQSPLYNDITTSYNIHNFYLPTNESFSISWDIDSIYKKFEQYPTTQYMSLKDFDNLFASDLNNSKEEFDRIYSEVKSIYPHTHNNVLTIFFKPLHCNLIVDGRHRYIEFKKFKPNALINLSYFNSNDIIDCIISSFDLVKYIIINNIDEINNFILNKGNLEHIIDFEKCGLFI